MIFIKSNLYESRIFNPPENTIISEIFHNYTHENYYEDKCLEKSCCLGFKRYIKYFLSTQASCIKERTYHMCARNAYIHGHNDLCRFFCEKYGMEFVFVENFQKLNRENENTVVLYGSTSDFGTFPIDFYKLKLIGQPRYREYLGFFSSLLRNDLKTADIFLEMFLYNNDSRLFYPRIMDLFVRRKKYNILNFLFSRFNYSPLADCAVAGDVKALKYFLKFNDYDDKLGKIAVLSENLDMKEMFENIWDNSDHEHFRVLTRDIEGIKKSSWISGAGLLLAVELGYRDIVEYYMKRYAKGVYISCYVSMAREQGYTKLEKIICKKRSWCCIM